MYCELCGKETDLFKAVVEGTELKVCKGCARFGKVVARVKPAVNEKKRKQEKEIEEVPEIIEVIVPDFADKVKKARESSGLKQEGLAKGVNEKESVIHKIETGHYEPNIVLAKKLERFLKINLVEEQEIKKEKKPKGAVSGSGFTIGDMIELKK